MEKAKGTWRSRGSCVWNYRWASMAVTTVTVLISLHIASPEPPSNGSVLEGMNLSCAGIQLGYLVWEFPQIRGLNIDPK